MKNIAFDGIKNARDFSGLKNKEGKSIKKGSFIRGSELSKASDKDVDILTKQYNLKTIIDLRTEMEKGQKPDRVPDGVNYLEIPLFTEQTMGVTREKSMESPAMLKKLPDMRELYAKIVTDDYCVSKLKEEFRHIIEHKDGTMLWHCTEGKDRCGITSALFLSILDFDMADIIQDFEFTSTVSVKKANKFYYIIKYLLWKPKEAKLVRSMYMADRRFLRSAFNAINTNYGSVDNYIRDVLEITDEERNNFKARFLE